MNASRPIYIASRQISAHCRNIATVRSPSPGYALLLNVTVTLTFSIFYHIDYYNTIYFYIIM